MKTIADFKALDINGRSKALTSLCTRFQTARKEIAKVLVAAGECQDYGDGEMNSYAKRITGIELRREAQGTYETVAVLNGLRSGKLPMTEAEFDSKKFGSFPLIMLSSFMSKAPEKVSLALEIIRSGDDVTNRLKELRGGKAKKKTDKEPAGKSGGDGDKEPPAPEIQAPEGTTFFIPKGTAILQNPELLKAIMAEIKSAPDADSCGSYHDLFKDLTAHVHTRWETLEAEAEKQPVAAAA